MTYRLSVRRLAERDLVQARDWYEEQQSGLGRDFLEAVVELFGRLEENPQLYPVVYRGLRRAVLRRFPYLVYFRLEDDLVTVVACLHGRRGPRWLEERMR